MMIAPGEVMCGRKNESGFGTGEDVGEGTVGVQVMVAVEPRSYREAIGLAIQGLRPHLRVAVVDPLSLVSEVVRHAPDLVLHSRPDSLPSGGGMSWVELPEDTRLPATVCRDGQRSEWRCPDLAGLLSVVDAVLLPQTAAEGGA